MKLLYKDLVSSLRVGGKLLGDPRRILLDLRVEGKLLEDLMKIITDLKVNKSLQFIKFPLKYNPKVKKKSKLFKIFLVKFHPKNRTKSKFCNLKKILEKCRNFCRRKKFKAFRKR